jgi:hypothetical protein
MLCLGVGAGLGAGAANVYGARLNTRPAATAESVASQRTVTPADLDALKAQLRSEIQSVSRDDTSQTLAQPDTMSDDELLRRVRSLIHESEQRQQRELALRVAEVARDVQAQRQADLMRIDRTLGVLQNSTGLAVRRQEQLLNSLAVRVSQRQEH